MTQGKEPVGEEETLADAPRERYPWLRALMLVVLYGALMIFLWNFPSESGRIFFQNLFRAFLYVGAGLLLVGITILFIVRFPLPRLPLPPDLEMASDDSYAYNDVDDFGGVYDAQSLIVPAISRPGVEDQVWAVLESLEDEPGFEELILFDPETGVVTVVDDDESELLQEIRARLKQVGITARAPR